jgi:broad specificity phosphatase PhoE
VPPPAIAQPKVPTAGWAPPTGDPTRLILVRHGSTAHSPERRFSGRNTLPLSELGERQAEALAGRAPSFGDVAAVISSPLRRTTQTAEAIAAVLGREVQTNEDLVEIDFGTWEGLSFAEVRDSDPESLSAWLTVPDDAPPGGESFASLVRRVRRARDAMITAYPGQTVVVVTHVTPIKALLQLALDIAPTPLFRMQLDTASVSITNYYADGLSAVRLVNGTSHLNALAPTA